MNMVRGGADRKNITFSSTDYAGLPLAWADPTRLRQVLIILLDNAIKFTPAGGKVRVNISEKDMGILVQVSDTGCGIPKDKLARIFDKLYQITDQDHADTSQAGRTGLGLGLHIARSLVTRRAATSG